MESYIADGDPLANQQPPAANLNAHTNLRSVQHQNRIEQYLKLLEGLPSGS